MDKVGGSVENEVEDQILARVLEESLRHYNEVEVPRLSQMTSKDEVPHKDIEDEEIGGVDAWDCWDEWDGEQLENVVKIEQSLMNDGHFKEEKISSKSISVAKNQGSTGMLNKYLYHEIKPKQTNISVGENGNDGADGFDKEAGRLWIYPCNFPVRKYQLDIVHSALFDNTLVSLPTGLGKTFIAAVVMYNFYRWFPMGKIIFLAPTRPLVAQQVRACYEIVGIPKEETLELTGSVNAEERAKAWRQRRVFFATPQVAANDLATGACPGDLVRCIVVDEAHRAVGNHSICQAIRGLLHLREQSPGTRFRILALSATPGRNVESVAKIVTTLRISKLELRDEQSPDVAPHTYHRSAETVVVPLGPQLLETRDKFLAIMDPYLDRLINKRLLYCGQKSRLNKFQILTARMQFRNNPHLEMNSSQKGLVEGDFATCITLTHALGLILTHGQRTFMSFIQGIINGDRGTHVVRSRLMNNIPLLCLLSELKDRLGAANSMPQPAPDVSLSEGMARAIETENTINPFITSHPKMDRLREIVIEHFEKHQRNEESTRVMIFCEFRDPVVEICNMLMCHWPLVKPMSFVGQASSSVHADPNMPGTSKGTKGFTQKQQLQAVRGFRDGGYNVLVSTCVGEEGLDIGEVDLIVCYDAPHSSPLRLIQRMGRTGRKREGRVVTLVTQDCEEQKHKMGLRQKNAIVKSLIKSKVLGNYLCRNSPRVLPPGTDPKCHMMPMVVPKSIEEDDKKGKKGKGKAGKTKDLKMKKGKGKVKAKNVEDIYSDDETNERLERRNVERGDVDAEEPAPSTSKGKGKGKNRKRVVKASPSKKPEKGIQDFFKKQKTKAFVPAIEIEEEFEDDDFVSKGKQQKKANSESNDVMIIDEDVTCVFQALVSKENEAEGSSDFMLPPDLKDLENAVGSIFGDFCCPCLKSNPSYRCSIIASHFQIKHTVSSLTPLNSVGSLDFLTAEALLNFDAAEEAKKVDEWKPDSFIFSPLETIVSLPCKSKFNSPNKENQDFCSLSTSIQSISPVLKKTKGLNEATPIIREKVIGNLVEDITEKDADYKLVEPKSQLKGKNKQNANVNPNYTDCLSEENLLFNVFGKKRNKVNTSVVEFVEDISNENDKMEERIPVSNKASITKSRNANKSAYVDDVTEKTPTKQIVQDVITDHHKISPLEIGEVESIHGSQENTPNNQSMQDVLMCKTTPPSSPVIGTKKHPFLIASSTPKVHRKNLFSNTACLASPIVDKSKKPADANFDLLPFEVDFSDHELFSPSSIKSLSSQKHIASPSKMQNVLQPSSLKVMEQLENEINYEIPNFDLGWEDEFKSDDTDDDCTFVDLDECNKKIEDDARSAHVSEEDHEIISLDIKTAAVGRENHQIYLLKDSKNFITNRSSGDKGEDSSKGYVEKSSEVITKNTDTFPLLQGRLLKGKMEKELGYHLSSQDNQSFTLTQMLDLLAKPEISTKSQSKESKITEKENELTKQNARMELNPDIHIKKFAGGEIMEQCTKDKPDKNYSVGYDNLVSPFIDTEISNLKNNNGNGGSPEKGNGEAIDKEINFDIGGEALLDFSADLFAEDDTQAWLRGSGEAGEKEETSEKVESSNVKEIIQPKSGVAPEYSKKNEELLKNIGDEERKTNESLRKSGFGIHAGKASKHEGENFILKSKNVLPLVVVPCLGGWNADGWLSKTVPTNKTKLSLVQKDNKRQIETDCGAKVTRPSLSNDKGSNVNKVNKTECLDETAFNSKPNNQSLNWIDEITSERVASTSVGLAEPQRGKLTKDANALCNEQLAKKTNGNIFNVSNEEGQSFNFEKTLDKYSKVCNDTGSKTLTPEHDFQKQFDEQHPKCYKQSHTKSEKLNDKKYKHPEHEGMSLDVKQKNNFPKIKESASKPKEVCDVVTLSSDSYEEDKFEDVKRTKSLSDMKKSNKIREEDENEINEDWNDWENLEGFISHDDDFESLGAKRATKRTPAANNSKEISISSEEKPPIRLRRGGRSRRRCVFLESQAEESFIDAGVRKLSSDEDDDDNKGHSQYYDPSFINDGLPHSQEGGEVDIHAKYLQSIRSPQNAKFKIPHLPLIISEKEKNTNSPKAHAPDPSDSCYIHDSFCVDGEYETNHEEDAESSVDELEVLEAILSRKSKDKKSQNRKRRLSSEDEVQIVEIKQPQKQGNAKRKRKRIVVHDSSDEEDEPCDPPTKRMNLLCDSVSEFGARKKDDKQNTKEPIKVKESHPSSSEKNCRELFEENKNRNILDRNSTSDSRAYTEKRTCELHEGGLEQKSNESGHGNLLANNPGISSQKGGKSKHSNLSKEVVEGKDFPDLIDEIAGNWSADLFDNWDLSDDEKPTAGENRNPASRISNQISGSLSKAVRSPSEPDVSNKQGKSDMVWKSKNFEKTSNPSHAESISKLSTNYHKSNQISPSMLHSGSKDQDLSVGTRKTCAVSPYLNSHDLPSTSTAASAQSASSSPCKGNVKMMQDMETLVLISPLEACHASEVVSILRAISKVRVVIFAPGGSTSVPYALGRNLCLFRCSLSDLNRGSKIAEMLQAAHKLYNKAAVIVEWGDENPSGSDPRNPWPAKRGNNWNSSTSAMLSQSVFLALLNFGKANINVLHSSGKDETAKLIFEVARHYQQLELNLGMQPIILPKSYNQSDAKLKFYASLPGVNPVQAFYLLQQFPKISSFLSVCSSAHSIQVSTGLDLNKALQLYKVLANVHISDT